MSFETSITESEEIEGAQEAKELTRHALQPFLELEQEGIVKGLVCVLHGSAVTEIRQPNDIDLLVLVSGVDLDKLKSKLALAEQEQASEYDIEAWRLLTNLTRQNLVRYEKVKDGKGVDTMAYYTAVTKKKFIETPEESRALAINRMRVTRDIYEIPDEIRNKIDDIANKLSAADTVDIGIQAASDLVKDIWLDDKIDYKVRKKVRSNFSDYVHGENVFKTISRTGVLVYGKNPIGIDGKEIFQKADKDFLPELNEE